MAGEVYTPTEMIGRLVGFDTTSAKSNLDFIDFVAAYLESHGLQSTRVHNAEGTKANLVASIGPDVAGGVVLSGHTDVVPVAGQDWDTDPFTVVERDGNLYGRGSTDMKSFIAVALTLVPELLARDLRVPLHFAFSYDEEVGCFGAIPLLEHLCDHVPKPLAAIIGEPTAMKAVNAHRGVSIMVTEITGRTGHASATHKGVSAVAYAGACIEFLSLLADELREAADAESDFDPPYTTINVGRVEGGSAVNVIAPTCRLDWEYRTMPGGDGDAVMRRFQDFTAGTLVPRMRAIAPEADVRSERKAAIPPFAPEPGSPAEDLVLALTGQNKAVPVQFASEAGMFQQSGIPAIICGPGDPDQAHRANEHIALADVEACRRFLLKLADWAEQG